MLTKSDLEQIKNYLALYGKKDSQLEAVPVNLDYPEVTFEANDYLSVVQDNKNKTIKIKDLEKVFLLTFLTDEDFREALKGKIPEEMLENACVTTEKLADGAVTTIKLGNNAVTTAKIATGAITSEKIANNTIQGAAFAANSITTDKIVDGTVTGDKLADGSIQSVDIKDNTLSGSKFVDGSISGSKIQDNVIESKHLLDNSIPASKIKDGSIESVDIKDGTLDGSKIKDNTIESAKLANNAITTDKIIDNSITTGKIANNAVTEDKIVDDSITTVKIANSSVTTGKIVDEAITEDKLANGAVTTAKLADGLISEIQNITDATPTAGSVKPVQSGGVKTAIDNVAFSTNEKVKNVGIDSEPTAGSKNLVKSEEVYKIKSAIKCENTLQLDVANQNVRLSNPILRGSKIASINGYSGTLRGRTNSGDSTYFVISDGAIVDRDINWVNGSIIGDVTISVESIDTQIQDLKDADTNLNNKITENQTKLYDLSNGINLPFTVSNSDSAVWYKLPFTVKAGAYITFRPEGVTVYGKTNLSDDSRPLSINTVIPINVNYIRFSVSGDNTVIFSGIYSTADESLKNTDKLFELLRTARLFKGYLKTTGWDSDEGFHYMIPIVPETSVTIKKKSGVSSCKYAFIKNYNVQSGIIEYATGSTLIELTDPSVTVTAPVDAKFLYTSYLDGPNTRTTDSIIIDGYDWIKDSIFTKVLNLEKSVDYLQNLLNVSVITPELVYNDGNQKYIDTLGIIHSHNSYHYTNPISVKKNDLLVVSGRGGSAYCCLALQKATSMFTPIVNYSSVGVDIQVKFNYTVKEDCDITLSSRIGNEGLFIIRGLDDVLKEDISNIIGVPITTSISKESLIVPDECLDNTSLEGSSPATPLYRTEYWTSNFIPIDDTTNFLFVNTPIYRAVQYNENFSYVGFVTSTRIPLKIDVFSNRTTKYVRIVFKKSVVPFEDRGKVRITKSINEPSNSEPINKIDGYILGLNENSYISKQDLSKFEAEKVFGTFVSESEFDVDNVPVELNTSSVYIDTTNSNIYRYSGQTLYNIGYYDNKAFIFTNSFSVSIPRTKECLKNMIVYSDAKFYRGDGITDTPKIRLRNYASDTVQNETIKYVIGGDRGYKQKEWRAQRLSYTQYSLFADITIPDGVTLMIDEFGNYYSDKKGYYGFPRLNAHALSAPDNSIRYMEDAAKLGFSCVITIPKRTSDGVWVCFHDDDHIGRFARNEDGSAIQNPGPISSYTYEQLMQFDFGIYNGEDKFKAYRGLKIPLLQDFFIICAKTGMHPMLSIHPNFTESEWREVKSITDNLGITKNLNFKFGGGTSYFSTTYPVFGTDIESYALDAARDRDATQEMIDAISTYNIDASKVKLGIEYFYNIITVERVQNARNAGLFVAMTMDGSEGTETSEDYEYWMMHGVSEFTDNNHTSVGLNW